MSDMDNAKEYIERYIMDLAKKDGLPATSVQIYDAAYNACYRFIIYSDINGDKHKFFCEFAYHVVRDISCFKKQVDLFYKQYKAEFKDQFVRNAVTKDVEEFIKD